MTSTASPSRRTLIVIRSPGALPRTIAPGIARELIFAGEPIDAARALELRLVSRVVSRERLYDEAASMAAQIAALPRDAVRGTREAIRRGASLPLDEALHLEAAIAARVAGTAG